MYVIVSACGGVCAFVSVCGGVCFFLGVGVCVCEGVCVARKRFILTNQCRPVRGGGARVTYPQRSLVLGAARNVAMHDSFRCPTSVAFQHV